MNGNGIWKTAALAMSGMLITGVTSWLVFGVDKMTRQETFEYVEKNSPYVRDREVISRALQQVVEGNRTVQSEIRALVIEQTRLTARVDMVQQALVDLQKRMMRE